MSEEPANNNIEKQVQAYAESRRQAAGEPLEMHPATRQMLQSEIAHTLAPKAHAPARVSGWAALLRLAWATGIAAVVTLAFVLTFKDKGESMRMASEPRAAATPPVTTVTGAAAPSAPPPAAELAAADEMPQRVMETERSLATRPAPAANPGVKLDASSADSSVMSSAQVKSMVEKKMSRSAASGNVMADATPPVISSQTADQVQSGAKAGRDAYEVAKAESKSKAELASTPIAAPMAIQPTAPQATKPAAALAAKETTAKFRPENQLMLQSRFVQSRVQQSYRRNLNSPPVPEVLQSFEFSQAGASVTVIDADGSVYTGQVETPESLKDQVAQRSTASRQSVDGFARSAKAMGRQGQIAEGEVAFTVTGTNQSLQKLVIFTGVATRGRADVSGVRLQGALGGQNVQAQSGFSRISGRAQVGTASQIPVEVVPEQK